MLPAVLLILASSALVILYDTIASTVSRFFRIPYAKFVIGSWLTYASIGLLTSLLLPEPSAAIALLAGAASGFTDATAGWAVSWMIGPGRVRRPLTFSLWARVAWKVTLKATAIVFVTYYLGRLAKGLW